MHKIPITQQHKCGIFFDIRKDVFLVDAHALTRKGIAVLISKNSYWNYARDKRNSKKPHRSPHTSLQLFHNMEGFS